jgi:hypothetical protein
MSYSVSVGYIARVEDWDKCGGTVRWFLSMHDNLDWIVSSSEASNLDPTSIPSTGEGI